MASSLPQIFHHLWQSVDDTVSHLLATEHPQEQICGWLRWLSNNIDAEWTHLSFSATSKQHEHDMRNTEVASTTLHQPSCPLGSSTQPSCISNTETSYFSNAQPPHCAAASSSSLLQGSSRNCRSESPPRNERPPLPPYVQSAVSDPRTPSHPSQRSASMPPQMTSSSSAGYPINNTTSTTHVDRGDEHASFVPGASDTVAPRAITAPRDILVTVTAGANHPRHGAGRERATTGGQISSDLLLQDHQMQLRPRSKPSLNKEAQLTTNSRKRALVQQSRVISKRIRSKQADKKDLSALLKEIGNIPQNIVQPRIVLAKITESGQTISEQVSSLFVRLFYTIASPEAILHLKDACMHIRQTGRFAIPKDTDTPAQTIHALDALETAATTQAILRRYHLTRLIKHRMERETQHTLDARTRSLRKSNRSRDQSQGKTGRASTLAISELVSEAYPHLKQPVRQQDAAGTEYGKRHKSVVNMLQAGRNWDAMQELFSPGILALILTGRDSEIHNSDIERVPVPMFRTFLHVLDELRGDFIRQISEAVSQHIADILYGQDLKWRYIFEATEDEALRSYPLDASILVNLCAAE